jgi:hypothetical protein
MVRLQLFQPEAPQERNPGPLRRPSQKRNVPREDRPQNPRTILSLPPEGLWKDYEDTRQQPSRLLADRRILRPSQLTSGAALGSRRVVVRLASERFWVPHPCVQGCAPFAPASGGRVLNYLLLVSHHAHTTCPFTIILDVTPTWNSFPACHRQPRKFSKPCSGSF